MIVLHHVLSLLHAAFFEHAAARRVPDVVLGFHADDGEIPEYRPQHARSSGIFSRAFTCIERSDPMENKNMKKKRRMRFICMRSVHSRQLWR